MRFELGSERLLPRWVVTFFVGGAVILIPWIVLMFTVPQVVNVSRRWELVWGGFDCFLVLGFAVTAFRLITRSPRGAVTAAMTGTMLLIDAWFDVLTTHRGGQLISILMAVFAEIPCALICFYVSRRIVGLFEQAKEVLGSAGFLVRGGQLVPPANFPAPEPQPEASLPAQAAPVTEPILAAEPAFVLAPEPPPAPASGPVPAAEPVPALSVEVPSHTEASGHAGVSAAAPAFTVLSGSAPPTAPTITTSTPAAPTNAGISSTFNGDPAGYRTDPLGHRTDPSGYSGDPAGRDASSTSIVASRDLAA